MCGIAGFLGQPCAPGAEHSRLQSMITTLHHRGPDGYGYHVEPGVGLVHARLSIIDLATGAQPMSNADGTIRVLLNGEIFNYRELRAELELRGHRFRTRSDTEVIVHLYQRYGDDFVQHLNGQFAIAVWDSTRRRLVMARDRCGIRPLFHADHRGSFWFASEMKALFAGMQTRPAFSASGLMQTFTYWAPLETDTIHEGIHSLAPGHLMALEADGRRSVSRYWDWQFPVASGYLPPWRSVEEAARELRERLVEAIRLQLQADVPVGAYLSGGLDSSAIVALAQTLTQTSVRTFSVAFDQAEFDESAHQQRMVRHLGSQHTTLTVTPADIGRAFPRFIRHAEVPVLRTAGVPMMLLADSVRAHGYKVVLTGEGADEVFAGYDLFKEAKVRRFWARQPGSTLRPRLLGRLYGYLAHSPAANPAFAAAFFGQGMEHLDRPVFAHAPRWTSSQRALSFLSPELRAAAGDWQPLDFAEARLPDDIMRWAPLSRDQYVEAKTLLAGYLLSSQGDRPAMAGSIESRFPFLDHSLIEFANRLPPAWKLQGLNEKSILRKAVADLLPPSILQRTKQPYRAPDSQSFFVQGQPIDYVAALFDKARLQASGLVDVEATSRLFQKARAGRITGFAENQAFVGILSLLLLQRPEVAA